MELILSTTVLCTVRLISNVSCLHLFQIKGSILLWLHLFKKYLLTCILTLNAIRFKDSLKYSIHGLYWRYSFGKLCLMSMGSPQQVTGQENQTCSLSALMFITMKLEVSYKVYYFMETPHS